MHSVPSHDSKLPIAVPQKHPFYSRISGGLQIDLTVPNKKMPTAGSLEQAEGYLQGPGIRLAKTFLSAHHGPDPSSPAQLLHQRPGRSAILVGAKPQAPSPLDQSPQPRIHPGKGPGPAFWILLIFFQLLAGQRGDVLFVGGFTRDHPSPFDQSSRPPANQVPRHLLGNRPPTMPPQDPPQGLSNIAQGVRQRPIQIKNGVPAKRAIHGTRFLAWVGTQKSKVV